MEEARYIKMINNNPNIISTIDNPTDEMKILAIKKDGLAIRIYKKSNYRNARNSIENNIRAIKFIENPTEEMMIKAVNDGWSIFRIYKKSN